MDILTQAEADGLLAMEKHRVADDRYFFPAPGSVLVVPLQSADGREAFLLDLHRGRINLGKVKYQTRARHVVILARLDLGGPPHQNPDGVEIPSPHLHLYRQGFGDKWAFPLPGGFRNPRDPWLSWEDFLAFCQVTRPPLMQRTF